MKGPYIVFHEKTSVKNTADVSLNLTRASNTMAKLIYQQRYREKLHRNGRCTRCTKPNDLKGKTCSKCLLKRARESKLIRTKLALERKCERCRQPLPQRPVVCPQYARLQSQTG